MTEVELQKVEAVIAKVAELRATVENSLSIRAVGGVHVANELIKLQPVLEELKAAVEADLAAEPEAPAAG